MTRRPVSHEPVLLHEVLEILRPAPGQRVVDATVGLGGHAEAVLEAVVPGGRVVGVDRDPEALDRASRRLARFGAAFTPVRGDFRELPRMLSELGIETVDAILADLGVSSLQLDDPERGFSFRHDAPLDMRMDPSQPVTAADLLAEADEAELRRILAEYGEERRAAAIARALVRERDRTPITTTRRLADVVEQALGPSARRYRIHPATRTFQALRIAVNRELEGLDAWLREAVSLLRPGGRLVVIAFHSLEDRAVKHTLRDLSSRCTCPPGLPVCACGRRGLVRILTPRPVRPTDEEIRRNPRSRSARMRAAERLP